AALLAFAQNELSAHQLDQSAADRQAEAGALRVARRRGARLAEGLEYALAIGRRDARARVLDDELEATRAGVQARGEPRPAGVGERDRVAEEVADDLRPAQLREPHEGAQARVGVDAERQALALRAVLEQAAKRVDERLQIERLRDEIDLRGGDARVLEDVVDEALEQVVAGLQLLEDELLVGVERRVSEEV